MLSGLEDQLASSHGRCWANAGHTGQMLEECVYSASVRLWLDQTPADLLVLRCRSQARTSVDQKGSRARILSCCAKDIHNVQNVLCKQHAQQNKPKSLLCTAILGFPGNLQWSLGLGPRVILGCLRQPRLCMCRGGYLLHTICIAECMGCPCTSASAKKFLKLLFSGCIWLVVLH